MPICGIPKEGAKKEVSRAYQDTEEGKINSGSGIKEASWRYPISAISVFTEWYLSPYM